ncbi:PatB family C-S lyase [Roseibacterium sp. SDUM158016]|uniref:MalY/PatB family protein n=1 Tax=Roseicyclus sediminis TaxID=2980997 RepID=UPI0021CF35E5|nr:PatB family C-S lyase [Roseibacterium sp. SDUM158016]MCU4652524.1 PatB family C-S lyase [Roseibacterium sp. SDUM158016]
MSFDEIIDRRGTISSKWDRIEALYGIPPAEGIAMWTADSDYPTAPCVIEAVHKAADFGIFGYTFYEESYLGAIQWWMQARHGWRIEQDWILTCQGLGNAIQLCLQAFSAPGERVAYFTPVYHEFRVKTEKAGRVPLELPMVRDGDSYVLDLDDAAARITPDTRILIFCAPQNPSGRIWTREEMAAVAAFAERHDLILVSDEVHCDLLFPGQRHVPMDIAAPEMRHRTVTLNSTSKTFNLAGMKTGNMIVPDPDLRGALADLLRKLDYMAACLALPMVKAAYSPEGAAWVDAQMEYLEGNRRIFDEAINRIPGVWSMPLQATYLPWVDFSGTGMTPEEVAQRIHGKARIAVPMGAQFGTGGETFVRFNIATPRAVVAEAVARMQDAFSDLQ